MCNLKIAQAVYQTGGSSQGRKAFFKRLVMLEDIREQAHCFRPGNGPSVVARLAERPLLAESGRRSLGHTSLAAPGRKPDPQGRPVGEDESGVKLESPWTFFAPSRHPNVRFRPEADVRVADQGDTKPRRGSPGGPFQS